MDWNATCRVVSVGHSMNCKSTVMADVTPRTGTLLYTPQHSNHSLETKDTNLHPFFRDQGGGVNSYEDQRTFYRFPTDFSLWNGPL